MRYFSVFSGVGGFELGIEAASKDFQCVGVSEIDRFASGVLRLRLPTIMNYGDIKQIDWERVPDFDLLVGGSPCQDLSVAGKRVGLQGTKSSLFWEFARCLHEKKPRHFIWENVKGALASSGGRDFALILNTMAQEGYSLWWNVLNAKDFGVPQNRERVFVVGTRDGSPREVFFETGASGVHPRIGEQEGKNATACRAKQGGPDADHTYVLCRAVLTPDRLEKRQNGRRMKEDGEPMFTVNAQDRHGVYDGARMRRLTPRECERLMSWPDDWTKYMESEFGTVTETSDSQRYKMCGNGVVSKVVTEVIRAHFL